MLKNSGGMEFVGGQSFIRNELQSELDSYGGEDYWRNFSRRRCSENFVVRKRTGMDLGF